MDKKNGVGIRTGTRHHTYNTLGLGGIDGKGLDDLSDARMCIAIDWDGRNVDAG